MGTVSVLSDLVIELESEKVGTTQDEWHNIRTPSEHRNDCISPLAGQGSYFESVEGC